MVGLWIIHPLRAKDLVSIRITPSQSQGSTYYFQAKSLSKQSGGSTSAMPQKTGLVHSRAFTPVHSVEKFNIGATWAYTGKKIIQKIKLPGIARTVYFVQIFTTNAALPSTVSKAAV